jgi:GNAT superfamily N-acetyltransferase
MNPSIQSFDPKIHTEVKYFILDTWKEFGYYYEAVTDADLDDPQKYYIESGGMFYVLLDNNKIIGTIGILNPGNNIAELKRLYVDKSFRNKGYGSQLIDKAIQFCKETGFKTIKLNSDRIFEDAHKLYIQKGFKIVKEDNEDFYMELPI